MRKILIGIMVLIFAIRLFSGCSKASVDQLTGGANPCDTTHVSYATDIVPILQQFCWPCHSNNNMAFGDLVNLQGNDSGYSEVMGWAEGGFVVGNVTYAPGYIGMPYGKPRLDSCEVNKIVAWVHQGYAP